MKTPLWQQGVGDCGSENILPTPCHQSWTGELSRLIPLEEQLSLLPVGWGKDGKAPMFLGRRKGPEEDWTQKALTVEQILNFERKPLHSVGARTGIDSGPLLCFDIDGETALELACSHGMEPWCANTWQVHRTTDPFRLKILFRPTPEQIAQLPAGEFQGKSITADKKGTKKGEALEVFFDSGRQVIILGEHPSSGGFYIWPKEYGPEALSAPPDPWWNFALHLAHKSQKPVRHCAKPTLTRKGTRILDPCPICGRHSAAQSGLWCAQTSDGLILCMPGTTFNADPTGTMKLGTVINGYALVKRSPISEGDCLTFAPHKPRRSFARRRFSSLNRQFRKPRHG